MVSKTRGRLVSALTAGTVICLLMGFGYYTYHGTVIHLPASTTSSARAMIVPEVRVQQEVVNGNHVVIANLTLKNVAEKRVRLVDTVQTVPLYDVQIRLKQGNKVEQVASTSTSMMQSRTAAMERRGFDRDTDGIVELIPGSGLTRPLFVSALYDVQREGTYELVITYQPETVIKTMGVEAGSLNVLDQRVIASTSFVIAAPKPVIPDKKTPDAAAQPSEKKQEPAEAAPAVIK
ncbi:MAG TPA: hypothetical protein VEK08_17900 [Planctomycetota bacterium]|nr:hypothetical protein [Planctomycetota bacterium]